MKLSLNFLNVNTPQKIENLHDIVVWMVFFSTYAIPDMSKISLVLRLVFVLYTIMVCLKKKIYIDKFFFVWGVVFIIVSFISSVFSYDRNESLYIWVEIVQCIMIGFFLSEWIKSNKEKLINYVISSSFIFSIRLLLNTEYAIWSSRKAATMMGLNVNAIGVRLVFALLISVYMLIKSEKGKRIIYEITSIILAISIIICGSRRAFIVAIVSIVLLMISMSSNPVKLIKGIIISAVLIGVVGWLLMINSTLYLIIGSRIENMVMNFLENGSFLGLTRDGLISDGMKLFLQKPIFGWGNGSYEYVGQYNLPYTHNNYVELLFAEGLMGFVSYFSVYIYVIIMTIKNYKKNDNSKLVMVIIVAIMLCDIASPTYYTLNIQLLLVYCVVTVNSFNRKSNKEGVI